MSVVIATRDRAPLLGEAARSILAQDYTPLELILVDDGSIDDTPALLNRLEEDARVRSLRLDTPTGPAAARNAGAETARGELLLFEDDDCRGTPDRVEKLAAALDRRLDAVYAYCWSRHVGTGYQATHGTQGPWSIGTPAALIRARAFRQAGGFDPALPRLVDFDLWTRLLAQWPAVEVPEVLYEARLDDEGVSASDDRLLGAEARLLDKYEPGELPGPHQAAMHRRVGGKLFLAGHWRRGLVHFGRAVRRCPRCPRSWAALAAGLPGPGAYRRIVAAMEPESTGTGDAR